MTAVLILVAYVVGALALMWWASQGSGNAVTREDPRSDLEREMDDFAAALAKMNAEIVTAVRPALDRFVAEMAAWHRECSKFARMLRRRGL